MSAAPLPARSILAAGLAIGLAGDYLLRAPGVPGLNLLILLGGIAVSVWLIGKREARIDTEGSILIGIGILLACGLVWRGSAALRALSFLGAATALSLPALEAGRGWIRRAGVTDVVEAVLGSVLNSALGSVRLFAAGGRPHRPSGVGSERVWQVTRPALRGLLLATGPLAVFGGLLLDADPVFAGIVTDIVTIDLQVVGSHLSVVIVLAWLTCGYLTGFLSGTRTRAVWFDGARGPSLTGGEVGTALALVNVLFLGFVIVQFRYLFGGSELVEVTRGLTYSDYARGGFLQLVVATALALPWLLAADCLLEAGAPGARRTFSILGGLQIVLLMAIVASAMQRMRYYLEAYGLTELRFFATALLIWIAIVLVWFAASVLRSRREPFVFGTLLSALALILMLQILNPDALIARTNLARARIEASATPGLATQTPAVDVSYLSSLGSDAVPVLLERISVLPPMARCEVARRLLAAWGPGTGGDWRSWNWSDTRARRAVEIESSELRAMVPSSRECI